MSGCIQHICLYATSKYMPAKYWSYLSGIHQLHLINFCHYCKFAWIHVASCSSIVLGWQSFAQKCRGSEIWTRAWWGFCHKSYQLGCENVSHLWWFWWFRFVVGIFRVDQLGEVDASNISGDWSLEKVRTRTTMKNEPQPFLLFTNRFVVESFSLAPNFGIFMVFMLPNDSKLQEKQKSRRRDCLETVTHSFPCDKGRCLLHIGYICWRIFFEVFFWVSRDGRICSARMTKASELHHKVLYSAIKQGHAQVKDMRSCALHFGGNVLLGWWYNGVILLVYVSIQQYSIRCTSYLHARYAKLFILYWEM